VSELRALGILLVMALVVGLMAGIAIGRFAVPRPLDATPPSAMPVPLDACHEAVHRNFEAYMRGDIDGFYQTLDEMMHVCLDEYGL
jgi:hypothetical protein